MINEICKIPSSIIRDRNVTTRPPYIEKIGSPEATVIYSKTGCRYTKIVSR